MNQMDSTIRILGTLTPENILLVSAILIFAAILVSRVGYRFGVPTLLLFLVVGMVFGSDGLGLQFNNHGAAQFVGVVAMTIILFTGGMQTDFRSIRPILAQGIVLSTLGVALTVVFTGFFIYLMTHAAHFPLHISIAMCFLMAAVMSSTDSASVFSILRENNMRLKENLQPVLELESGSNDPMAYVTTVVMIQAAMTLFDPAAAETGIDYYSMIWDAVKTFFMQIGLGAVLGASIGMATSVFLPKLLLRSTALYSILLLSIAFFAISVTNMLGGNGYLAVYIAGIIIGNRPLVCKKDIFRFMDGMTWIMQISMFLCLGLLVNPSEMLEIAPVALLIGIFMMIAARPAAVFLCLLPFRGISLRAKTFISWIGLKGAAPILFATYPIVSGIPGSGYIFNIVFFITLVSLVIQGMSIPWAARILKLDLPEEKTPETFGVEMPDEAGILSEYTIGKGDLSDGDTLKEISLPDGARVVIIKRGDKFIVPDGSVRLKMGDRLVTIIADTGDLRKE